MLGVGSIDLTTETLLTPDFKELCFKLILVSAPCAAVWLVVVRQSKIVAAFAQLSDVGSRDDMQKTLASRALEVDRHWFILGVVNVALTSYMIGAWPVYYFLYYTPKVLILILLRLVKFYKKRQHFLLWDFCYWANFLCIFYCWCMPKSPVLFRTVFLCANGPLAWSVLAFNHALIFHSYAHVTSVVVHYSPLALSYGLRWYAAPVGDVPGSSMFQVCDTDAASCKAVPFLTMIWDALSRFYLWWLILYYIWIFVALGSYIERNSYQTLWDRILVMKPVGTFLQKLLKRFPKLVVQLVYLLIHLFFSTCTMSMAVLMWHSQIAHFLFLGSIGLSTVKNAASFYFDVFESQYAQVIGGEDSKKRLHEKLLVSASPGLAELQDPLKKKSS